MISDLYRIENNNSNMTFQKYFGKKTKFMIATIILPVVAIYIKAGCQGDFAPQYTCTPEFYIIYIIILFFMVFTFVAWPVIGLFYLTKFIRTRKITN